MRAIPCVLAVALAACTAPDSSVQRGTPPPIEASALHEDAWLQFRGDLRLSEAGRDSLGRAVRLASLGRPEAVRATVAARAREAGAARRALLGLGLDPTRIEAVEDDQAPPLTARVALLRLVLHTRDCGGAIQPSRDFGLDVASSLDSLGRCVQANNLAQMLADPGDLLASPPLAPQPGDVAAAAVARARNQPGAPGFLPGTVGAGAAAPSGPGTPPGSEAPGAAGAAGPGAAAGTP